MTRTDPLGLYDVGEGEEDVLDSVQDVLDWIEEFLGDKDDFTDPSPHGLPWDPDDIVGAGSDLLLNIALELAKNNTPCSRWMKQIFEGMACGAATCDPSNCAAGPFSLGPNAGNPMRDCLESIVPLGHKAHGAGEDFMRLLGNKLSQKCKDAARDGACCEKGKRKPRSKCPVIYPGPPLRNRYPCEEIAQWCKSGKNLPTKPIVLTKYR